MKISVIIPVHNNAQELPEAIESALSQTLKPFEIVVVDDGSTDESARVAKGFGGPVRVIGQENKGPSAARNRAAKEARGDWLALLDADDLWLPQKLEAQAERLARDEGAAMVHSNGWVIEGHEVPPDLEAASSYFKKKIPPAGKQALSVFLLTPILTSSVMIGREVFKKAGGFDESMWIHEDADLFIRIMAGGGDVSYSPEPLMVQRCFPSGLGRDKTAYLDGAIALYTKSLKSFPEHGKDFKRSLGHTCRVAAWYALREDDGKSARRYWLNSFRYQRPGAKDLWAAALLLAGGEWGKNRVKEQYREMIELLR